MVQLTVSILPIEYSTAYLAAETVERKGVGHPDSMCDGFAETCSRVISKEYIKSFGTIAHHNLDKSLLVCAKDDKDYQFGDGRRLEKPIRYIQSGRVTPLPDGFDSTIEIMRRVIVDYSNKNFRYLNPEDPTQFIIDFEVGKGSSQLIGNARALEYSVPKAGDTSFGCGFAPFTPLENLVYQTEQLINSDPFKDRFPTGEDVKVMGSRTNGKIKLTCAIAMVQSKVHDENSYMELEKQMMKELREYAKGLLDGQKQELELELMVNGAGWYPTITGLCCERADEGQIGRGNRVSGLITPCRSSSMEAAAGKNPYNHVGKLYNVGATILAKEAYEKFQDKVNEVQVILTSQIGRPVTEPDFFSVKVCTDQPNGDLKRDIERAVGDMFNHDFFKRVTDDIVEGRVNVF